MTTDKITKISVFLLVIIVFAIIQLFIKNNILAISLLGALLIVIFIYLKISNSFSEKRKNKIIQQTKKVRAQIQSVKIYRKNIIILSLLVEHPDKFYTTSCVINNADEYEIFKYKPDQEISVHVNPKNQYEVFIPRESTTTNSKKPRRNLALGWVAFYVIVMGASFGIPIFINMFDYSDRVFKDIEYINIDSGKGYIWELRFESPKKIYIKIYDPVTKEKVKSIKEKKEEDLEYYTNFFICQQDQKVYIIGTGNTPVIDVYDAIKLEKISDIKKFELSNNILREGIASIQYETQYNNLIEDEVVSFTTNDGNKCFYDIQKNKFFYSQNEMKEYFEEENFKIMSQQMSTFALSVIPNSVNKQKLYLVTTTTKKGVENLLKLAGSNNLNMDDFERNHDYYYKYCELIPLLNDTYILGGKFIYTDESIAVIERVNAINENAEEMLSGIDKSGKMLFTINQNEYPNIKDMIEDQYKPRDRQEIEAVRIDGKMVFLFNKYGGLGIDIKTGNILWKYEP